LSRRGTQRVEDGIGVVRVIARLNIGGPAIQALTLTKELDSLGYRTTLVRGREEPDEGNMDQLAHELGVRPVLVPSLRRNPGWQDLPALAALTWILRRERPQIVHTHAAKGGTIGRVAALLACRGRGRRCILVHTYHGHSLTGYFSAKATAFYLQVERFLGRHTSVLIAVSDEVRDDLVALGVAPLEKFVVVRLGFDLSRFTVEGDERERLRRALRAELGIAHGARVVTLVARLVPIKRVDRLLRVANLMPEDPDLRFLIVGDGELRDQLQASAEARSLGARLLWAGFRRDMPAVCFASDVVVLTSDNEGTPVSLIEAQAAGTPVVSTRVGGVSSVVREGDSGRVVDAGDERGLADAIYRVLEDPGAAGRASAASAESAQAFSLEALVHSIDDLYRRLLAPSAGEAVR
jgi:glycosyltransferase involved in cell wall biosynthesis